MKTLMLSIMILMAFPVYAYVNYDSSNDANPNAYLSRIQQENQQEQAQQSQDNANRSAEQYYNHQTDSSYPNSGHLRQNR